MIIRVNGCCHMSLRVASLVIGWLDILFLVIGTCFITTRIIYFDPNEKPPSHFNSPFRVGSTNTLSGEIITLIIYLFDAVITGLLLAGIYKNKHKMILPWLVVRAIGLIVTVPIVGRVLLLAPSATAVGTIAAAFTCLLVLGLFVWCWIVVYSFYHEIRNSVKNTSQRQRGLMDAY